MWCTFTLQAVTKPRRRASPSKSSNPLEKIAVDKPIKRWRLATSGLSPNSIASAREIQGYRTPNFAKNVSMWSSRDGHSWHSLGGCKCDYSRWDAQDSARDVQKRSALGQLLSPLPLIPGFRLLFTPTMWSSIGWYISAFLSHSWHVRSRTCTGSGLVTFLCS